MNVTSSVLKDKVRERQELGHPASDHGKSQLKGSKNQEKMV